MYAELFSKDERNNISTKNATDPPKIQEKCLLYPAFANKKKKAYQLNFLAFIFLFTYDDEE